MTAALNSLLKHCDEKKYTHSASSKYFSKLNKCFALPSIILTSGTSLCSFLAASVPDLKFSLGITVGILGTIASLIVALSSAYKFSSKEEAHSISAECYDRLRNRLFFKSISIEGNEKHEKLQKFFIEIENESREIGTRCKYLIPEHIEAEYKAKKHIIHRQNLVMNLKTIAVQSNYNNIIEKMKINKKITSNELKLDIV